VDGLREIAPEALHVTLCFLGWQAAGSIPAIAEACAAVVENHQPAELRSDQAIWLPPRRPRVLAVELVDRHGGLGALQMALSDGLERGGWYRAEKRPFRPHITVARLRRGTRVRDRELRSPPELRFTGVRTTLFRSRLSPSGARYEAL
jgi:2'-5' RNA ligase